MMKKTILALLITFMIFTTALFSAGKVFRFQSDKGLAESKVEIVKKTAGQEMHIMNIYLFINKKLKENNVTFKNAPDDSLGFLYVEIVNEDYFNDKNRNTYEIYYDYSPIWGFLKEDSDKYAESFIYYRQNQEDFGGRSYCSDCGEPMAYGNRQATISDEHVIWLKNKWVDYNKSYEFEIEWKFEGVPFNKHFKINE